ncbi:MAG TPA: glycosyltransferase family 4 protein [Bryobacteraceae bacterium]|jgi:glycosyltransferase involved in cell wall biosynthesis|nr:glycosyltransferase family 4 protein [Bryobacteraceae bacterium]
MGGAQAHVLDLISGLSPQCEPLLATGEKDFLADEALKLGIECFFLPELVRPVSPWKDLLATRSLLGLIRATRPVLTHVHTSKAGMVGRFASRAAGVPSVYTVHLWPFEDGTGLTRAIGVPLERLTARFTSRIITVSDATRQTGLRFGIGREDQLVTIHNGISDTPFRARLAVTARPKIAVVARFVDQKDHVTLLRAVAGMTGRPQILFIGDGPRLVDVRSLCENLGLSATCEFAGERRDVPQILAGCDLFVLPTNWEGFPLSILEAMRAGLPVIATDVGGNREAVAHEMTGLLTPHQDVAAMRQAIESLCSSFERRVQFGRAGRRRFLEYFSREQMLSRTLDVYQSVSSN